MSAANKKINLTYFAILRDQRGASSEIFSTSALTAQDLYVELQSKYHFDLSIKSVKVSINDQFTSWDAEIKDHDHVVFIPPVAGG